MLWATRRGCHVDRTACVWLIRRYLDEGADFLFFGDPAEAPGEAELFDVAGARLSHRGGDCSFETFLKEYGLADAVLREIGEIVHDADLMDRKITAVVGPSGAGKSTLLRAVNRLIELTAGEIYLDGQPTDGMDLLRLRRRVGIVFQLPVLFGQSVEEAILYGAHLAGLPADAARLPELVGLDRSLASREPETLSVGQQQRVSIARALALEPEVLLMDEPMSALDEAARRRVEDLARGLNARLGLTMVFVSHDLAQVERVADRVILLAGG